MTERKKSVVTHLSDTLHLVDRHDGFWLNDDTRGMNIAIRAKTREAALLKALAYYQNRLLVTESRYKEIKGVVKGFVSQLREVREDPFGLRNDDGPFG